MWGIGLPVHSGAAYASTAKEALDTANAIRA
jgi:hypothetical protein